jgi:ferritin-like metal-binding protein YciE
MPDAKHIYTQSLQNTHAAETQGLQQIELQLKGLEDYPDYAGLLRGHVDQTREQLTRIEQALEDVGSGRPALRETVTGTVGTAGAAVHGVMPDTTLKNLYAGCAFQGEMIAAYTSLAVIAKAAGFNNHLSWIETSIDEEKASAKAALNIVPSVTERFLAKQQD